MRIPGVLQSIYWRRRLKAYRVRPWSEMAIDAHRRKPSVAIVGNAGYLRDLDLGEQIDACDVVVRMNNFVIDGYERSAGHKIDLYAVNFAYEIRFNNPAIREAKWVMATVPCNFLKDRQRGLRFRHGIHIARGLDLMRRDEVFVPSTDYVCAWYDKLGSVPTSGVMTILLMTDLLRDRVGDVLLAGFSFYQGRSHYYSDEVIVPQIHNPPAERTMLAEYLRDMTASGRVTLDPVMKQHLYPNHGA